MSKQAQNEGQMVVGVDLDNTIVSYDNLLQCVARERSLINAQVSASKREVRDAVRELPEGDIQWQKLQGIAYGPRMGDATLILGVMEFLRFCKHRNVPVHVISHKTQYAPYDETKTNLREAALGWMDSHGLLECQSTGLSPKSVCFEDSRQQKLERITQLGCTHFIDDLEETFLEDSFPQHVDKILFSPNPQEFRSHGATVLTSWQEIKSYFVGLSS